MKKISLANWAKKNFVAGSAPSMQTLRSWCEKGEIDNAIKLGSKWYVEVEPPRDAKDAEIDIEIDKLVGSDKAMQEAVSIE